MSKEEVRRTKHLLGEEVLKSGHGYFEKLPPEKRTELQDSRMVLDEKGECFFLDKQHLCGLQCKYGEKALSRTCRDFPRKVYGYGDIFFYTLSLGCEKVLETILDNKEKITLESGYESDEQELYVNQVVLGNKEGQVLKSIYFNIINFYTALLQADEVDLEDKLILLGIGLKRIDELIADGKTLEIPGYCEKYLCSLENLEDVSALLPKSSENSAVLLSNLFMTAQDSHYKDEKDKMFSDAIRTNLEVTINTAGDETTISYSAEKYAKLQKEYEAFMKDKENFIENVLLSFMYYRYLPFWTQLSKSVWENYMYLAWISSIVKFYLTASMPQIHSDADMIDRLTFIFRWWGQNVDAGKEIVERMHESSCDDLAHLALLLKSC